MVWIGVKALTGPERERERGGVFSGVESQGLEQVKSIKEMRSWLIAIIEYLS